MLGDRMTFHPGPLRGAAAVPGDKSISHRALIAGARGVGPLRIRNLNAGRDVQATLEALRALGVGIEANGPEIVVRGGRLREPFTTLDCMNSGSTARMLLGVCAGADIRARFDGDASLRRRPMEPVAAQLRAFGARIETSEGRLPMASLGTPRVETRNFILLAPSAQVKSALLFAGFFAGVAVSVSGDRGSRDHTERLLRQLGAVVEWDGRVVRLGSDPEMQPPRETLEIPGDFSAAAFFITATAITPGSSIFIRNSGVNPTRIGLIEALRQMGARIQLSNERMISGEPVADVAVEHRPLYGTTVEGELTLRAIDEIPLLAVAAAFASGATTIAGIGELRTKESDRVAAIERLLRAVNIESETVGQRLTIRGGTPSAPSTTIATHDDHRIAMAAAALAGAVGPITIDSAASIDVSFPAFLPALEALRSRSA
jgi:3-phosphoshikimate 1-carboxyvinyltransferase